MRYFAILCQLSITNYRVITVNCQSLPIINCQLSIVNYLDFMD